MAILQIAGTCLNVKDYDCALAGDCFQPVPEGRYLKKKIPALWLYVNVTNRCNASCPFCVNGANSADSSIVDPEEFEKTLWEIVPHIYGISFTGGEPMLYPELLDELVMRTSKLVPDSMEIDLATNGTNLAQLPELKTIDRITSVHISRHAVSGSRNNALMGRTGPGDDELKRLINDLNDPGKIVFNCVMQKGGVQNSEDAAAFLDFAIDVGVQNTSFISMFQANSFCREHYVSAMDFPFISDSECSKWNVSHPDSEFVIWNRHNDYEYCHCLSGSYHTEKGYTRFYFRCPGSETSSDYCRQLVYTADNRLQDGFGENRKVLVSNTLRPIAVYE